MLGRIVLAVVVGVVTTLGCILVGSILQAIDVELAVTVGNFLRTYSGAFGLLAGLWYFFAGYAGGPLWPRQ